MAGKQLVKVINAAIKAGKTEARVLAEGSPFSSPSLFSPCPPLPSPPGLVDATQPDLANQSPPLGWEAAHRVSSWSQLPRIPSLRRLGALLAWGVSGSDGVLLRRVVCRG